MDTQLASGALGRSIAAAPSIGLPQILHRVEAATGRIHELANTLEAHADRVFGAQPTSISNGDEIRCPEPHSHMAALDQALASLHAAIDRAQDEASRNTCLG